jgi:hypothetical protein
MLVLAGWFLCMCRNDSPPLEPPGSCASPDAGSEQVVSSLHGEEVARDLLGDDAVVTIQVAAVVPCLQGGMNVTGITNLGTLVEQKPGSRATIYLASLGQDRAVGYAELKVPYGLPVVIVLEAGDRTTELMLGPYIKPSDSDGGAGADGEAAD